MAASIETILDLPTAVVSCAFQYLSAKDLAICMSICSLWRDIVPELLVWESHVRKRWRHWDLDKWQQLRDEGRWKVIYDSRMAVCLIHLSPHSITYSNKTCALYCSLLVTSTVLITLKASTIAKSKEQIDTHRCSRHTGPQVPYQQTCAKNSLQQTSQ